MVGEDGRAVPLGGAPDHHVQKAVGRLNVMFLERETAKMLWAVPAPGSSGERAGGKPGAAGPAVQPPGPTGHPVLTPEAEDIAEGAPFPGQGCPAQGQWMGKSWSPLQTSQRGWGGASAQGQLCPSTRRPRPTLTCSSPTRNLEGLLLRKLPSGLSNHPKPTALPPAPTSAGSCSP